MLFYFFASYVFASNQFCVDSSCTSCSSGNLYLSKSCLSVCPTTFSTSSQTCISSSSNTVFEVDLFKYHDYSVNTIGDFTTNNNEVFSNINQITPVPTKDRGFYFVDSSEGLKYKSTLVPAPDFSIKFLINFSVAGLVFSFKSGSDYTVLISVWSSGINFGISFKLTHLDQTLNYVTTENKINQSKKTWFKCLIYIKQDSGNFDLNLCGTIFTINGEFKSTAADVCIGDCSASPSSFKGFMYYIYFLNKYDTTHYEDYSPVNCDQSNYYDYTLLTCKSCIHWPLCSYSSSNACYSSSCTSCTSYSYGGCTACASGTAPSCSCVKFCQTCSSTFSCNSCSSGTLINGLCLFPKSVSSSSAFQTFEITFDTFAGTYSPFKAGASATTFYHFNSPDSDDPIPAKNRGIYFNGNSFLESISDFSLSYKFSLVFWIRITSGSLLWDSSSLDCYVDGHCEIYLSSTDEERSFKTGRKLSFNGWHFFEYKLGFDNYISTFEFKVDDEKVEDFSASGYYLIDKSGKVVIGDGFFGFLYLIILDESLDGSDLYKNAACTNNYGTCLWDCDLSKYIDNSVIVSCMNTCTQGCVRSDSCNLCSDLKCTKCESFSGGCSECISGTIKTGDQCNCPSSQYFDSSTLQCLQCNSECLECSSSTICTSCVQDLVLQSNQCKCSNSQKYWDGSNCIQCNEGCVTCTTSTCQECSYGTYFKAQTWTCQSCPNICESCESEGRCVDCIDNAENVNGVCICENGYGFNGKICEKCENFSENGICQDCPVLCSKCSSQYSCSICKSNAILVDGLCECIDGYTIIGKICAKCETYIEDGICMKCPNLCLTCNAKDSCQKCIEDSTLHDGVCECDEKLIEVEGNCQTCVESTYFLDGSCQRCPSLCIACESENLCTECIENASANNGKCSCDAGYSGDSCEKSFFTFNFEIFKNNSFLLEFSESLKNSLEKKDISIYYNKNLYKDFQVYKSSGLEYLIKLNFGEDIKKDKKIKIEINKQTVSIKNSLLYSNSFEYETFEYLTEATKNFRSNEKFGSLMSQILISIAAFTGVFNSNNPSSLWGFVSWIQYMCYLRLLGFDLPSRFEGLLKGLTDYNMIPNVFSTMIETEPISVPNKYIKNYGFDTSYIIVNAGKFFLAFIAIICMNFLLGLIKLCIKCIKSSLFKEKIDESLGTYKFNKYLRFWIQSYLDIFAAGCVALLGFEHNNGYKSANLAFAVFILIMCSLSPFVSLFIFKKVSRDPETLSLFSTMTYDIKTGSDLGLRYFYGLYFIERFIFMFSMVFLYDTPLVQLIINFIISLLVNLI